MRQRGGGGARSAVGTTSPGRRGSFGRRAASGGAAPASAWRGRGGSVDDAGATAYAFGATREAAVRASEVDERGVSMTTSSGITTAASRSRAAGASANIFVPSLAE